LGHRLPEMLGMEDDDVIGHPPPPLCRDAGRCCKPVAKEDEDEDEDEDEESEVLEEDGDVKKPAEADDGGES